MDRVSECPCSIQNYFLSYSVTDILRNEKRPRPQKLDLSHSWFFSVSKCKESHHSVLKKVKDIICYWRYHQSTFSFSHLHLKLERIPASHMLCNFRLTWQKKSKSYVAFLRICKFWLLWKSLLCVITEAIYFDVFVPRND